MDPLQLDSNQHFVNSACPAGATTESYEAVFPAGPGFPAGYPIPVSNAFFINRIAGSSCAIMCTERVLQYNGTLQLLAVNGSYAGVQRATTNGTVVSFNFNAPVMVPTPVPTLPVQMDPTQRLLSTRYVRVSASAGNCL